ncbi:SDR family NAD(P)-dependent oxidoreductase [Pleomorphomonas carboxyditropha]|uniref:3-oxoacyl-ACP reductase n=1 Tax=Pleomorphomonas carboxyditropha TaxID=2023338 RepID=A0A2G9X045_9HYPH|nr:SDR family oxidoreductase [Pleomorphomonas carboxyditropha]PIP00310.1 3-oxoacyl-ACP reductase [Pleomorphomonas carboxyditropha]
MPSPFDTVRYRSLEGRKVLVTGGASGIGEAIVTAFGSQGATVAFLDIDEPAGQATAAATGAMFIRCDVTDIAALRGAIAGVEERLGAVDVLVNNAGRDDRHSMEGVEPDGWREALAINLDHQFFATQAVAAGMRAKGRGSVIMMGSVSWMRGNPAMVGYTTAKAAINGLTRTLARDLGPAGIRVNCIVPGAVETERQKRWFSANDGRRFVELQALKFRLNPTHVARLALFLGSDESAGCTGANFMVDAGLTQN